MSRAVGDQRPVADAMRAAAMRGKAIDRRDRGDHLGAGIADIDARRAAAPAATSCRKEAGEARASSCRKRGRRHGIRRRRCRRLPECRAR